MLIGVRLLRCARLMGTFLYIPWFKLDAWDVALPALLGVVAFACLVAMIVPKWRQQAMSTLLVGLGVGAAAYLMGFEEVPIQPFGILVATGVLLGARLSEWYAKREGIDPGWLADFVTHVIVIGFVACYILNGVFYETETLIEILKDPRLLFQRWLGLSSYGGFFGAMFGLWVWKKRRKMPTLPLADAVCFGFPLGWFFGRMGCFVVHDHPGSETTFFLGVENYYEGDIVRHDLGLYEVFIAGAMMLLFLFIYFKRPDKEKRPMGLWCALMPLIYAPIRFFLDYLRATDLESSDVRYSGLTPGQYASIAMFIVAAIMLRRVIKKPEWTIPDEMAFDPDGKPAEGDDDEDEEKAPKKTSGKKTSKTSGKVRRRKKA